MAAEGEESGGARELFNVLRSGDRGVSFDPLAQRCYFLQHRRFTLFDMLDAFRSSAGASERYLGYRDFQIALAKMAKLKYENHGHNGHQPDGKLPLAVQRHESELLSALLEEIQAAQHLATKRMDTLRKQIAKASVVDTLRSSLPKLVQGFQLYGSMNRLAGTGTVLDASEYITFEGFVDFLNAYFEYEDYFSYNDLTSMMAELRLATVDGWSGDEGYTASQLSGSTDELFFAQFIELFCRVSSAFHHKALLLEGAQLRRAIETCRLEFSIELLLQHMNITLLHDDSHQTTIMPIESLPQIDSVSEQNSDTVADSTDIASTNNISECEKEVSRSAAVRDITSLLASVGVGTLSNGSAKSQPKRSVLFSRLPPRRSSPTKATSTSPEYSAESFASPRLSSASQLGDFVSRKSISPRPTPPRVVMIREIVSPPPMPKSMLQLVENAIKYQNAGQYHMALSTLDACQAQLHEIESTPAALADSTTELQVYFDLLTASVLDSARRDALALAKYVDALKAAEALPSDHPARLLARSCMACTLFYMGEVSLSKQAHQQVLDVRKAAANHKATDSRTIRNINVEIDLATAMNNVGCCLSQEVVDIGHGTAGFSPIEEAFLLFKEAKRIYIEALGPSHPRVEIVHRNLEHARSCQVTVVTDPHGALERGEYAHVIPGSVFQIRALEPVKSLPTKKKGKKGKKKGGTKKKSK